jgi:pyruvate/2-oxoglutarate dehydrogenase complex dihydrolipoamide acyltransferase (E2) component
VQFVARLQPFVSFSLTTDEIEDDAVTSTSASNETAEISAIPVLEEASAAPKGKYPMTPAVRRIVKEHNLDPGVVQATGKVSWDLSNRYTI